MAMRLHYGHKRTLYGHGGWGTMNRSSHNPSDPGDRSPSQVPPRGLRHPLVTKGQPLLQGLIQTTVSGHRVLFQASLPFTNLLHASLHSPTHQLVTIGHL